MPGSRCDITALALALCTITVSIKCMVNLLYTGAKSSLFPPTPVVLADGCELIERVTLVHVLLRDRSYRTTCTKSIYWDGYSSTNTSGCYLAWPVTSGFYCLLMHCMWTHNLCHATWKLSRHIQYSIKPLWKLLFEILASKHLSVKTQYCCAVHSTKNSYYLGL